MSGLPSASWLGGFARLAAGLLLAALLLLGLGRARGQPGAGGLAVEARWPLAAEASANVHPYGLAYLDRDTLLLTDPAARAVWALGADGRDLRLFAEHPHTYWNPTSIATHPLTGQAVVGDREWQRFVVLDPSGARARRGAHVRLPNLGPRIPELAALGPEGALFVLSGGEGRGQRVYRIGMDGLSLGRWDVQPRRLPEKPRPYTRAIAVDGQGHVYLALLALGDCERQDLRCLPEDLRPSAEIYRFAPRASQADYLGAIELKDDRFAWSGWQNDGLSLALDPDADRLLMGRADPPHVAGYDLASGAPGLYAYPAQPAALDRVPAVAARPGGGFAALIGVADNPKQNEAPYGRVVQFDADGHPRARLVLRAFDDPVLWAAARIAVDGRGRTLVLSPDEQRWHGLGRDGAALGSWEAPSFAVDIAADAGGRVALKGSGGRRGTLALHGPDGARLWEAPCTCDETSALALGARLLATGKALDGRLQGAARADGADAGALAALGPHRAWPSDLAAVDGGWLSLDGAAGRVTRWAGEDAAPLRGPSTDVGPDVLRLAAHPDGRWATLARDGRLRLYDALGRRTHEALLPALAGAEDAEPRDLDWSPSGRLHVLDSAAPSVLVLAPSPDALPPPGPTPAPGGAPICELEGDKTAAPGVVRLGEAVTVTLRLAAHCPAPPSEALDLALLLGDLSYGTGDEARDHELSQALLAKRLLAGLDLGRVQVAVYQEGWGRLLELSADPDRIAAAIDAGGQRWPYQQRADAADFFGFDRAAADLLDQGRPGARKLVLIGLRRQPVEHAFYQDSGQRARARGVETLILDFSGTAGARLAGAAGGPERVLDWREAVTSDLLQRFVGVAPPTAAGGVGNVEIHDEMGPDVGYEPGSAAPPAREAGDVLAWSVEAVDAAGLQLRYRIQPRRTGRLPTNALAYADYDDADGTRRRFVFPLPEIEVVGPTATASATPTVTPEPTPTPIPRPIHLPLALRERCDAQVRRVDVALVIDASSSMREAAGAPGAGSKLDAARAAVADFLDLLDLDAGNQAAILSFSSEAVLHSPLSADRARLDAALAAVTIGQQTRLDLAVEGGAAALLDDATRAPGNAPVLVLLTDGRANPVPVDVAVEAAAGAKAQGIAVFTIGLGDDLEQDALRAIASGPENYLPAPDAADLAQAYRSVAERIPCPPEAFWGGRAEVRRGADRRRGDAVVSSGD